jgi:small-conductance mechanosensitive channel
VIIMGTPDATVQSLLSTTFGHVGWQWLALLVAAILAALIARVVVWVIVRLVSRVAKRTTVQWDDELVLEGRRPTRLLVGLLAFRLLMRPLSLGTSAKEIVLRLIAVTAVAATGWLAVRAVDVIAHAVERRARDDAEGAPDKELAARGVATQVRVLRRVANVTVGVVALALMLTQFEIVRTVGMSLLASAGLAGVVLGFAAQRTIGSLIAGIQLSATQPIRIGDAVIVEKEYGTIEEITLTYVVVRIWDERRLIVPMTRFLEQPFENWTKSSSQLHGTVYMYVDWTVPVEAVRAELRRIVEGHPLWDGRTQGVSVTDTKERTLELRVLVSAKDAGTLFTLRCEVRERLVAWLQSLDGGTHLPRVRLDRDARPERGRSEHARAVLSEAEH